MFKSFRMGFYFLALTLLNSCQTNTIYDKTYTFTSDTWNYNQFIDFEFAVPDTTRPYDLSLQLRNSEAYSYSNLWLFIETMAPNGYVLRDTMEIILADETGRWLGKGIGNVNEIEVWYKQNAYFIHRGIFKISIQHAMRDSVLEGIMDIGFQLQYHK